MQEAQTVAREIILTSCELLKLLKGIKALPSQIKTTHSKQEEKKSRACG